MTERVPPIVDLRDLDRADLPSAIDVLARGMRDNPLHFAAFGDDPERRARRLGSHLKYRSDDGRVVIIPLHRELATGTLRSIIRQSGLSVEEFL